MPCSFCKNSGHNARSCQQKKQQHTLTEESPNTDTIDSLIPDNDCQPQKKTSSTYYCYFLGQHTNWNGQTYNGYTVNLQKRLRQHNGEIKGGAWATTAKDKGAWSFIAVLTSSSWESISRAMACEWNCRYPTRKNLDLKCTRAQRGESIAWLKYLNILQMRFLYMFILCFIIKQFL